jgi:hypothetical protein
MAKGKNKRPLISKGYQEVNNHLLIKRWINLCRSKYGASKNIEPAATNKGGTLVYEMYCLYSKDVLIGLYEPKERCFHVATGYFNDTTSEHQILLKEMLEKLGI